MVEAENGMATTTITPVIKLATGREVTPKTALPDGKVLTAEIKLEN